MYTISEWLTEAEKHKDKLRSLVAQYHPAFQQFGPEEQPITAHGAQVACDIICTQIAKEVQEDVLDQFDSAFASGDWEKIYKLLHQSWFGVPESTGCWRIEGFSEAVDLMDDPPEIERTV